MKEATRKLATDIFVFAVSNVSDLLLSPWLA